MGTTLRAEVGLRLRRIRHARGYSPAEAGAKVGRDSSVVLRYERGEMAMTLDVLAAFARVYGVSLLELLPPLNRINQLTAASPAKGAA